MKTKFYKLITFALLVMAVAACTKENGSLNSLPLMTDKNDVCTAMDDINFMKYCYDNFDVNKDGKVSSIEAKAVTRIDLHNMQINSIKGIEYFSNLKYLYVNGNNFTSPNPIYHLSELEEVYIYGNLSELNLGHNKKIKILVCSGTFTSLDVSQNTTLIKLKCYSTKLTNLNVSKNIALEYLYCGGLSLTNLDVSKNTALIELDCSSNKLTNLNMRGCPALRKLECDNNQMQNTALNDLFKTLPFYYGREFSSFYIGGGGYISFRGNPGAKSCDGEIATSRGWNYPIP